MGEDQAWDRRAVPVELGPVLIASRGTPDAVDRAAVRNVIETDDDVVYANYPAKRTHPYEKPPEVLGHILARVCRRGDLVLDPFAGSGSSRVAAEKLGLYLVWKGCDIDPQFAETSSSADLTAFPALRQDRPRLSAPDVEALF